MSEEYAVFEKAPLTDIRRLETTDQTVVLTPKIGRKYLIDEILADGPSMVDIYVGNALLFRMPIAQNDCTFTPKPGETSPSAGFLNWLRQYVLNAFIKATPEKPITLKFTSVPTKAVIYYYDIPDNVNMGKELTGNESVLPYVNIVGNSATINATKNYPLDMTFMPTGTLALKDGSRIPANVLVDIYALAFSSAVNGGTEFTQFHIWAQDVELITPEDHKGITVTPGENELQFDITKKQAFILSKPYTYKPGYQITLNVDAVYDGTNTLGVGVAKLWIIGLLRSTK